MAIFRKGSDPVALRAAAERVQAGARACEAVRGEASRAVHALRGHWGGGNLERLMSQWPAVDAQLGRFGDDLGRLAEALRRNAGQQDSASGQGGGIGSGVAAAGRALTPPSPYDIDGDGVVSREEYLAVKQAELLRNLGRSVGPPLLHLDDEDGFQGTPQGQGYDEGTDELLTTYNGDIPGGDHGVMLSIQDRETGYETGYVHLTGGDHDDPNKGGGVATDGEFVWVADTEGVYVYRRSDIDDAGPGEDVPPIDFLSQEDIGSQNASYVTYDDGHLYVGEFDKDTALPGDSDPGVPMIYRYDVNPDGTVDVGSRVGQQAPNNAQGVAVTDDGLVYSASYGGSLGAPSDLVFQEFDDAESFDLEDSDDADKVLDLPQYGEGITIIGDDVYVTHESGSHEYDGEEGHQNIQIYDLDDLDDH